MATTELRPLSLGELLDRTFSYYRQHFWLFMGIMAIPQVLNVALSLVIQAVPNAQPAPVAQENPTDVLKHLAPVLLVSFAFLIVFVIVSLLIYAVALGATTHALSEVHLGRTATVSSAYRSLQGKMGRLAGLVFAFLFIAFGVYLGVALAAMAVGGILVFLVHSAAPGPGMLFGVLVVLVTVVMFLAGLVIGIIVLLRYGVAIPALVLENVGVRQALRRSAFLTKGYKGHIFVIVLLMYLVTAVVAFVFQAPFFVASLLLGFKLGVMPLWLRLPYAVSAGAGGALAGPFLMIALALAYYDTRVRKEGFDLQLMMAALDQTSPAATPVAAIPPVAS
jgi:MFS family permease